MAVWGVVVSMKRQRVEKEMCSTHRIYTTLSGLSLLYIIYPWLCGAHNHGLWDGILSGFFSERRGYLSIN
jgi:hypothetical protein